MKNKQTSDCSEINLSMNGRTAVYHYGDKTMVLMDCTWNRVSVIAEQTTPIVCENAGIIQDPYEFGCHAVYFKVLFVFSKQEKTVHNK